MNHKFNNNIIELFPKAYIMEFELSFDPKEIVQKLNTYMSDTPTPSDEAIRIHVDYNNPLAGGIEIADGYSRAGSSHSPFGSILDQKEFSPLQDVLLYCIEEYNKKFNIYSSKIIMTNSWCNVMSQGSTLKFHMHAGSILSGIYYPQLPEGAMNLSIIDPKYMWSLVKSGKEHYPTQTYNLTEKYFKSKDDNRKRKTIPLKEGHLYVFPSWLEHGSTDSNKCDERISISFNTIVKG